MIKLIKNTSSSIINNRYTDFAHTLMILSAICSIVFSVFAGICYFIASSESIGAFALIAPPGDKIWLIIFITAIISIVFGFFTVFADLHYKRHDERRFLIIMYFWIFTTCSGALLVVAPFILLYDFAKYLFYVVNFCFEHFFMLFAPRKTKEKMIVSEKTEKEMINTYNSFLRN